jgi:hypothetical protein
MPSKKAKHTVVKIKKESTDDLALMEMDEELMEDAEALLDDEELGFMAAEIDNKLIDDEDEPELESAVAKISKTSSK